MAEIINGKVIAERRRAEIKLEVEKFRKATGIIPKLAVVLAGEDPSSIVYVRNKEKGCSEVGMESVVVRMPGLSSENEVLSVVKGLNSDKTVHGILVQLPLPERHDPRKIIEEISPQKDVDGLTSWNLGRLLKGEGPLFTPCTPTGIIELVLSTGVPIEGKRAVVIGRSNIVGKPVAVLLLRQNATVTICHSKTVNLGQVVAEGEIVIAAVGSPELIKGGAIRTGAIVIDVGVNRVGGKLIGDVEFAEAAKRAAYITPVPGGVGPMTITLLLQNTLGAAKLAAGK